MKTGMEERWVTTERGRVYAKCWRPAGARGAALVLLHDSLGCVELWREFPRQLAEGTGRVVAAYDRLGFGRSEPRTGPIGRDFMRAEGPAMEALRGAFGLGSVVPVGHSAGGGMAVAVAADAPAVVTISAHTFVEEKTLEGLRAARLEFDKPGRVERLARYHGERAAWVLESWLGSWLDEGFRGWTLDAELALLRCPLLAMQGDRDEYGTRVHGERLVAAGTAGSRLIVLEGVGHFPHREAPEQVVAEIGRFLGATGIP